MKTLLPEIERWLDQGQHVAVATVISTVGSSPRPVGSKMAISESGSIAGSVSGGCIEGAVFEEAQDVLRDGRAKRLSYGITDEQAWTVGLTCGGQVDVLVERFDRPEGR